MMYKLAILFFVLFTVQGIMTFFQINNYRKNISEIRKKGDMFIGQAKGKLKAGCIVVMALGADGIIKEARIMSGMTVFNRFRQITELDGKSIYEVDNWLEEVKSKQLRVAILKGIEAMKNQLAAKEESAEEEAIDLKGEILQ
ncbi:MAG: hypothetical protein HGA49_07450 [Eubacteriaceae bacterium]|nr:hypothetical protein [Eubacteriaceae bacterium]